MSAGPYREDGRSDAAREAARVALEAAIERAKLRVRAAAGGLKALEGRFDEERRVLDAAIADAEDAVRRALHRSMAQGTSADARLRDRMRQRGAVAALERAMARKRRRAPSDDDPATVADAQALVRRLRARRAKLHARADEALERARARLADAVTAHDEAVAELERA